ncbi:Zn-ribbon domain-containing OB-fold protein [Streptomyces sp. CA-100214]
MTSIVDLTSDPPKLHGGRCLGCGFVFFPFQTYGCEKCGSYGTSLQPFDLSGSGEVTASTVVHRHADPARTAPFRVARVTLDEGPSVRGLVVQGRDVANGDRVQLARVDDTADDERLAVQFAPIEVTP